MFATKKQISTYHRLLFLVLYNKVDIYKWKKSYKLFIFSLWDNIFLSLINVHLNNPLENWSRFVLSPSVLSFIDGNLFNLYNRFVIFTCSFEIKAETTHKIWTFRQLLLLRNTKKWFTKLWLNATVFTDVTVIMDPYYFQALIR